MIDFLLFPCREGGYVRGYGMSGGKLHRGIDIAPTDRSYKNKIDNLVCDDGKVIAVYSISQGEDWGASVIVEHQFTGYKRWSGYFHQSANYVKVGQELKMGDAVGRRGNTGLSSDEHVHFQLTDKLPINLAYTPNNFNKYAVDPEPMIFRDDRYTEILSPYFAETLKHLPVIKPVIRNKEVKQVEVLIDYLYMRSTPNGEKYNKYCPVGIYNVLDEKEEGNYRWYLINKSNDWEYWVASGGNRTKDLPVENEVETLKKEISLLNEQVSRLSLSLAESNGKLEQIKNIL